jgi:hypothetical protein
MHKCKSFSYQAQNVDFQKPGSPEIAEIRGFLGIKGEKRQILRRRKIGLFIPSLMDSELKIVKNIYFSES